MPGVISLVTKDECLSLQPNCMWYDQKNQLNVSWCRLPNTSTSSHRRKIPTHWTLEYIHFSIFNLSLVNEEKKNNEFRWEEKNLTAWGYLDREKRIQKSFIKYQWKWRVFFFFEYFSDNWLMHCYMFVCTDWRKALQLQQTANRPYCGQFIDVAQ